MNDNEWNVNLTFILPHPMLVENIRIIIYIKLMLENIQIKRKIRKIIFFSSTVSSVHMFSKWNVGTIPLVDVAK